MALGSAGLSSAGGAVNLGFGGLVPLGLAGASLATGNLAGMGIGIGEGLGYAVGGPLGLVGSLGLGTLGGMAGGSLPDFSSGPDKERVHTGRALNFDSTVPDAPRVPMHRQLPPSRRAPVSMGTQYAPVFV